jgi:hypothetical protein
MKNTKQILLFAGVFAFCVGMVFAQTPPKNSVTLTWTASTSSVAGYNIYRETTSGQCTDSSLGVGPGCLKVNGAPISALTFLDNAPPLPSWYVVRAVDSTGLESVNSNEAQAVTVVPTKPAAPSGLKAKVN